MVVPCCAESLPIVAEQLMGLLKVASVRTSVPVRPVAYSTFLSWSHTEMDPDRSENDSVVVTRT